MSNSDPTPYLLLVDGHAYAYRAFHAIRSLNAPDGAPTNALYGFIKMLQKMEGILKPTHLLVLWDGGLSAERMVALPEYKQQRPPTPEALSLQLPQLRIWLAASGIASWKQEGDEADDWIGVYTRRAAAAGWRVVIASSDKDFMQLVTDRTGLFNPNDKSDKVWGPADVVNKTGVNPSQIVDWLSLIGDAADNIPGVPGVGPKTSTDLLRRFGTIEILLSRLAEIKSERQRTELHGATEAVRRNQQMVALNCDLKGGPELDQLAPLAADLTKLRELYRAWGFGSLLAGIGSGESPVQGNLL